MVRDLIAVCSLHIYILYVIIPLGPSCPVVVFTADVYMKCSFAVQGLCVGAVVGGVSVWVRVHVCM